MFSSCLESIEPEGLNDLRGAKADLLRAQTALVEAQAAQANAQAALLQAEAKIKEAIAAQEAAKVAIIEAEALLAQYQAEYQALVNAAYEAEKAFELEQAIAAAEAAKAAAELEAQKAAAQLELDLLEIQTEVAIAQAAYDQALKDLAAARVTLSPKQKEYIFPYEMEFAICAAEVEGLVARLEVAAEALEEAIAVVDENKADKRAIYYAEKAVAVAEAALEGAKEAAAYAEAALEIDPIITDWDVELKALAEELETVARTTIEGVVDDYKDADYLAETLADLTEKYEEYEDATGYYFNEATGKFSVVPVYSPYTQFYSDEIYVAAPRDEEGNFMFTGDFHYANGIDFRYGEEDAAYKIFDDKIETLSYLSEEYFDEQIASAETFIAEIEEDNAEELARYETAVAAYKTGKSADIIAYYQTLDEDYDIETVVEEYNAATEALVVAHKAYNDAIKEHTLADNNEEKQAATDLYNETVNAARAKYVTARQVALDDKNAAEVTYNKATLAWNRANRTEQAIVNAAVATCGVDTVQIRTVVDNYDLYIKAGNKLTEAEAEQYSVFSEQNNKVKAARAALETAKTAWEKAEKAWSDAVGAYDKAIAEATDAYGKTNDDAYQLYWDTIEDLAVGVTGLDPDYRDYLTDNYSDALFAWIDAEFKVRNNSKFDVEWTAEEVYILGEEGDPVTFYANVPTYIIDEETSALKDVEVDDVIDAEWFLENEITWYAEDLVTVYYEVWGCHSTTGWISEWRYFDYTYESEDMPLVLPTAEEFAEFLDETKIQAKVDYADSFYADHSKPAEDINEPYLYGSSFYAEIYAAQNEIARLESLKANLPKVEEFVAALKAAKAEFEAFVAEKTAEIDALRTEVEENWVEVQDALAEMEMAYEAVEARVEEIIALADFISTLMEMATGEDNLEAYVAALEQAYADAVEAVTLAEFDLEDAQADLELVMAGGEDAITEVEMAQKAYDKVAAELAEALAELDAAAEALDAAMVAVGAAEPEETPAE